MSYQQSPRIQSMSPGPSFASSTRLPQSPGEEVIPSQGLVSSPAGSPQQGGMTHAPSSHFVSSGSFDFGGRGDSLGTTGLLPALELGNLGLQPLEMTEMELESTPDSDTFVSPREWGAHPPASTHGPAGPSGLFANILKSPCAVSEDGNQERMKVRGLCAEVPCVQ